MIHFIILSFCILSYLFVVQIYKIHNFFNFYNSFSRVFEFLSGAIIFLYNDNIKQKIPSLSYNKNKIIKKANYKLDRKIIVSETDLLFNNIDK